MKKIVFRHLFLVILSSRWPRLSHTIIRRHKTIFPARGWRARETRLLMDRAWLGHNRSMSESDPLSFITSPSNALRLAKENFFSVCNFTFGMFCARNSALSIGSFSLWWLNVSLGYRKEAKNVSPELASLCGKLLQLTSKRDGEWSKWSEDGSVSTKSGEFSVTSSFSTLLFPLTRLTPRREGS